MDVSAKIPSSKNKEGEMEDELGDEVRMDVSWKGVVVESGKPRIYRSDERIAPPRFKGLN